MSHSKKDDSLFRKDGLLCNSCSAAQVNAPAPVKVNLMVDLLPSKFGSGLIIGFCLAAIAAGSLVLVSLNGYYWYQFNVLMNTGVMLNDARFRLLDLVAIMAFCPGLIVMGSYLMVFTALCQFNQPFRNLLLNKRKMSLGNALVFGGAIGISSSLISLNYDYYNSNALFFTPFLIFYGLSIAGGIALSAVLYCKETRLATKFKAQTVIQ
jgi:hypothetical protein